MKRELRIISALAIMVVIAVLIATSLYRKSVAKVESEKASIAARPELVRDDSPTLGSKDAPVTIVEFLDPECESCKAFFPIMKEVLKKYEGKVFFVVRYMGFHRSSMMAVAATEAAGLQGQYWQMQELLFSTAEEWGHHPEPVRSFFVGYASTLGLDINRFEEELDNHTWTAKVQRDMADGAILGVKSTPTIFINGRQLADLSQASLEEAIERALLSR